MSDLSEERKTEERIKHMRTDPWTQSQSKRQCATCHKETYEHPYVNGVIRCLFFRTKGQVRGNN